MSTPRERLPRQSEKKSTELEDKKAEYKSIVVIGHPTNKVWVGHEGALINRRAVERLREKLSDYTVLDYTNTSKLPSEDSKDDNTMSLLLSSTSKSPFNSLEGAEENISQAECIVLSIGGNDFEEFSYRLNKKYDPGKGTMVARTSTEKEEYIQKNFDNVLKGIEEEYIKVVQNIRSQNSTAKIILTTQYYPPAAPWHSYIYPLMKEVGKARNIEGNPQNVLHEIIQQTYKQVLQSTEDLNITVADVTLISSLDKNNSAISMMADDVEIRRREMAWGVARILHYMVTHSTKPNHVYTFLPKLFINQDETKCIEQCPFDKWIPKHPNQLTGKACYDPERVIEMLNKEDLKTPLNEKDLDAINKNEKLRLSLIVLEQVSPTLVTRQTFQTLLANPCLQGALFAAHGYLNSDRFGCWHTHGAHGRRETERFINALMTTTDYSEGGVANLMRDWIRTSNVHNSSRAFYAYTYNSRLFKFKESKDSNESKDYLTASSEERRSLLNTMLGKT